MMQLQFEPGDAKWHAYRKRAQNDLYWLNEVVLGLGPLIPMRDRVHKVFCRFIERRTGEPALDDAPVRLALMPRETGKTTLCTKGRTIQLLCKDPNRAIILANEKEDNARKFLSSIKQEFEANELLRALFPELIPDNFQDIVWRGTEICVKRDTRRQEPSVLATGVGGTVTGMHPDDLILDDIISIEAMRNAKVGARQVIEAVNDWLHTLKFLCNKNASEWGITVVGTHWWHDDCYDHALQYFGAGEKPREYLIRCKLEDGTTQTVKAYRAGEIAWMIRSAVEDGQSIFPEKWSIEDLAIMRMADPVLFSSNMQNNPTDDITSEFKEGWLKTYEWVGEDRIRYVDPNASEKVVSLADLDRLIMVDPGGFGVVNHGDRARAAVVLTGSAMDGWLQFLLKAYSDKDTYLNAIRLIVDWARRYQPRKIVVEQTAQQAAFVELLKRELGQAKLAVPVEPITPRSKAKEARILELEPFFQQGRVYIGRGPEFLEFRAQYSQFPRAVRRDLLDVFAYGPYVWRKASVQSQTHDQRQRREVELLRQRMAATMNLGFPR